MRFRFLLVFCAFLGLQACDNDGNKFTVLGDIENLSEQEVFLEEIWIDDFITIDSTMSDKDGKFELNGTTPEPALYRLRFNQNRYVLLSIEKGNIKVVGDWANIERSKVIGSGASNSLAEFLTVVRGHIRDFNTMEIVMDSLRANRNDSLFREAAMDLRKMNQDFILYIEGYADSSQYIPNAIFAAKMLNPQAEKEFYEAFVSNLKSRFPNSRQAQDFVDKHRQMMAMNQMPHSSNVSIGKPAPEIKLATPTGEMVSLSSFRGQYVLVDFWASWCGPCRRENPNVVNAYNAFKDKNFTILGVSLDQEKDNWENAIAKDKLTWTHVSDLKGWQSIAARIYNVSAIPSNFLIDPEGNIIARDLSGTQLHSTLAQLLP